MHPVLRKLSLFAEFDPSEERAIASLFGPTFAVEPRTELVRENDPAQTVVFLLEGFACRSKIIEDGRRQVLGFLLPGDCCDPGVSILQHRDHTITALSPSVMARVSDVDLDEAMVASRKLRFAINWSTLVEEAVTREWLANVGQRPALARLSHLICETYYRLAAIGLTQGQSFRLPVTQGDLAEAMGISSVHVNRTLQDLRSNNLVSFGDKRMTILNLEGLEALSGFDASYLHLDARYKGGKSAAHSDA